MQDDRKFSGHGDLGLQEADPFDQPEPPGLEPAPVGHAGEQHACGLEEVGSHHGIAAFGDPAGPIDLARGVAARRQAEVGANRPGAPGAGRLVYRRLERGSDRRTVPTRPRGTQPAGRPQASASGLDRQRLLRATGSQEGPGVIFFAFQTSDVILWVFLKRFHTKWTPAKVENGPVTLQFLGQLR